MHLRGPVVRMCVEGVEEVFLDPVQRRGSKGPGVSEMAPRINMQMMQSSYLEGKVLIELGPRCELGGRAQWSGRGATYFLSWPPLINSMLSCDLRSGSMVAGV